MKIRIESDQKNCKKLWNRFGHPSSIFSEWDFRMSFFTPAVHRLHFMHFQVANEEIAAPLWYDKEKKYYEWFGGEFCEDNVFLAKKKPDIKTIIASLPRPLLAKAIVDSSPFYKKDEIKYIRSVSFVKNLEQLLRLFSKKHRYNLKRGYGQIKRLSPKIRWITDVKDGRKYLSRLVKLSKRRFPEGNEDESIFFRKHMEGCFLALIKNQKSYRLKLLIVEIKNKTAAVDIIAIYKNRYYPLIGSNDLVHFPAVGNFTTYLEFEDALKNGCDLIDALQGDCNWKHRYFDKQPLYKFERK
ncbi:GNAT family N-acetyltransferase [Candidatus Roizmanbacteria bacterium]|nr:GNAT family N-acetyltransferase [Candidatus Roizmanbacteria bacterium]